jgi:hypothetical protein
VALLLTRRHWSNFYFGVGIALGSTSGSAGDIIGCGTGVGVGSGVKTSPLLVVKTPPDIVTSSTK